jgi:quinol monooxygenase YgiN
LVVATIRLLVSADYHRELLQTVQSLLDPIRAQKGCLGLHLYCEIGGKEALCLIEEWATQGDLDEHLRSNYFVVLLGAARLLLDNPSELEFRLLTERGGMEVVEAIHGRPRH